jgi:hypothetical protein
MGQGEENELIPSGVSDLMEEANGEIMGAMMEGILPKIKVFIPKAIKSIDEDPTAIIDEESIIVIARSEEDGSVVVLQGKKDNLELSVKDMERVKVNDLSSLFELVLDMIAKGKNK